MRNYFAFYPSEKTLHVSSSFLSYVRKKNFLNIPSNQKGVFLILISDRSKMDLIFSSIIYDNVDDLAYKLFSEFL